MTLVALEAPPPDDAPTPPQDRAAERAVLGAMLTSAQARDDVLDILTAQDLNLHAHELIWDAVAFLHWDGSPVDQITVADHLESRKVLHKIGGRSSIFTTRRPLVGGKSCGPCTAAARAQNARDNQRKTEKRRYERAAS